MFNWVRKMKKEESRGFRILLIQLVEAHRWILNGSCCVCVQIVNGCSLFYAQEKEIDLAFISWMLIDSIKKEFELGMFRFRRIIR